MWQPPDINDEIHNLSLMCMVFWGKIIYLSPWADPVLKMWSRGFRTCLGRKTLSNALAHHRVGPIAEWNKALFGSQVIYQLFVGPKTLSVKWFLTFLFQT